MIEKQAPPNQGLQDAPATVSGLPGFESHRIAAAGELMRRGKEQRETVPYQPLRVPPGWRFDWNTLCEVDPTEENVRLGFFGGSSLLLASHEHLRLFVDVEWRPEDDPAGEYVLRVMYAPWQRTERGRRKAGTPDYRSARTVHEFRTRSRSELVRELEAAFRARPEWREGS